MVPRRAAYLVYSNEQQHERALNHRGEFRRHISKHALYDGPKWVHIGSSFLVTVLGKQAFYWEWGHVRRRFERLYPRSEGGRHHRFRERNGEHRGKPEHCEGSRQPDGGKDYGDFRNNCNFSVCERFVRLPSFG